MEDVTLSVNGGVFFLIFINPFSGVSFQEEQAAKLKAEKIRVALEKIKEAQVKKVGVERLHNRRRLVIFAAFLCELPFPGE